MKKWICKQIIWSIYITENEEDSDEYSDKEENEDDTEGLHAIIENNEVMNLVVEQIQNKDDMNKNDTLIIMDDEVEKTIT